MNHNVFIAAVLAAIIVQACKPKAKEENDAKASSALVDTLCKSGSSDSLPKPYATKSAINFSKITGWPADKTPVAPAGFDVIKYSEGFQNPRWLYVTPNGDVLVAEASTQSKGVAKIKDKLSGKSKSMNESESSNRITLLRDKDQDGKPEVRTLFLAGLNQPLGMLVVGNSFYVANTDGVMQFPYHAGETKIKATGKKIVDLPAGGYNNHWTRNIIANATGSKLYISVGSGSNNGEHGMQNEIRRANILEINPDGKGERIFASGIRNPVGMAFAPGTNTLYTSVNERDELGDNLVPDYFTEVKENGFYGWPYSYWGQNEDPRMKGQHPELVKKAIIPDVSLGAHTASLGLAFYDKKTFPEKYHNGAFIGQHGSWNKSKLAGYKVIFIPFKNGKPAGKPEDFLTGFVKDIDKNEVYGRPVGVAVLPNGSLLVADDASNTLWLVRPTSVK